MYWWPRRDGMGKRPARSAADQRNATFALNKSSIENCMENLFHINRTDLCFFVINVLFERKAGKLI